MGKASRTKKERVKAPSGAPTSSSRPAWLLPAAGAGLLIAIVVVVLALTVGGGGGGTSDESVAAAMKSAGCTLRAVKPLPPVHDPTAKGGGYHEDVPSLTANVKWSTDPPSAGAHFGNWAIWNFYYQAVNPRMVVHNEEHGGMIIWWGPKVAGTDVDKMYAFYQEDPLAIVGTPYANLGSKIALTAWTGDANKYYKDGYYGVGHIAVCSHFDETAFKAFRDAYRGKGPEGIPASQDVPGTGPQAQ